MPYICISNSVKKSVTTIELSFSWGDNSMVVILLSTKLEIHIYDSNIIYIMYLYILCICIMYELLSHWGDNSIITTFTNQGIIIMQEIIDMNYNSYL